MSEEVVANMRARVEQCRRLAKHVSDQRTAETLRKMAEEVESDIRRLLSQGTASG
jgi:hypothetical protein